MSIWKFTLLGQFQAISPEGDEITLPGASRAALIAMVLLKKNGSLPRSEAAAILWHSRSDKQRQDSLKNLLSRLKQIQKIHPTFPIESSSSHIRLREGVDIDVDVWKVLYPLGSPKSEIETLLTFDPNHFLASVNLREDAFIDWKLKEKQIFEEHLKISLHQQLSKIIKEARYEEILDIAEVLLRIDDCDERAHRALMFFHYQKGNNSLAISQFNRCQALVETRLKTSVSIETMNLYRAIRSNSIEKIKQVSEGEVGNLKVAETSGSVVQYKPAFADSQPSIAVLPFEMFIDDSVKPDFGSHLAEEITRMCAKFRWFHVIPVPSILSYSGQSKTDFFEKVRMSAKYILTGCIRLVAGEIYLFIDLVDSQFNRNIWNGKQALGKDPWQEVDGIAGRVSSYVDVNIRTSEVQHVLRLAPGHPNAYQCGLRAISSMYDANEGAEYAETEKLFRTGQSLEPSSAWFYSTWSLWKMFCLGQSWVGVDRTDLEQAGRYARKATKLDPDDAQALAILGHYISFWRSNPASGRRLLDKSIRLNPNSSFALTLSAANYAYGGYPEEALSELARIDQLYGVEKHLLFFYLSACCIVNLVNRNIEQSIKWGIATVEENVGFTNGYKQLLVALGHGGDKRECQRYLKWLLELEPNFNIEEYMKHSPFVRDEDRQFYRKGLELAGVPKTRGGGKGDLHLVKS